jgi:hypothetical protein
MLVLAVTIAAMWCDRGECGGSLSAAMAMASIPSILGCSSSPRITQSSLVRRAVTW